MEKIKLKIHLSDRMSSNNTRNTTATASNASGSSDGVMSKLSSGKGTIGVAAAIIVFVGCFIGAFVTLSNFAGSKDDWNQLKPQITKIWILVIIGTFGLTVAALLYFVQDPAKTMYFMIVMVCLSFGLAFSSLSVAAISR